MFNIEIRANGTLHIEGYVNAVERDSRPVICGECGKCVEQVKAGVFDKALRAAKNIDMLLNHNKSRKLASTTEGTLTLAEDSIGLRASADITDEETIEKARSGKLRGWSFGFRKLDSEIEARADKLPRRILKAIDIFEVSVIDDTHTPCYAGTSIEMRAENETEEVEVRSSEEAPEVTIEDPEPVVHNEWCEPYLRMMALEEQRFNPYHDPTNGRFTDANGGSGAINIGKSIQKGASRFYSHSGKNGTLISDGYRIHKHKNIGQQVFESNSFDETNGIEANYKRITSEFERGKNNGEVNELTLPTMNEISSKGNKYGYRHTAAYDFGENLPLVNARYLREAMLAVPNGKAYVKKDLASSPIYIKNDSGDEAIILPIRKVISQRAEPDDHG